jgi:RHS repeat-associated protein
MGRLKSQKQRINTQPDELIVLNTYDELGQLESKKVGGGAASTIENSTGLQTVDYAYNIRGWLKQINSPTALGTDLFALKLGYGTVAHGGTKLYNGNIAETEWRTANTDNGLKWYRYGYDTQNRIMSATDNTGHYSLGNLAYDKNGNILSLNRGGHLVSQPDPNITTHWGTMDELTYAYQPNSNKLLKVTDAKPDTSGIGEFNDGNKSGDDYVYDPNGNMVKDLNKGIVGANGTDGILYNHLNLPSEVKFGGTNKIKYIYDATGVKLEKKVVESGKPDKYTYYAGNFVYDRTGDSGNGSLKFFNHPEGYVDTSGGNSYTGSGYKYVYQYKDHLGNVRLSYADGDNNGSIDPLTEILEENNYYPFGLEHKGYNGNVSANNNSVASKFKYNGKELDESLGLNMYDYGKRNYDPALGRWFVVDALADDEMQIDKSPYAYSWNSPVSLNDPDGDCPWCIGALVGAITEYAVQATINLSKGQDLGDALWNNIDGADILVAAGEGALTGGASALRRVAITVTAETVKASIDYNGNGDFDVAGVGTGNGATVKAESQKSALTITVETTLGTLGAEGSNKIDNIVKSSSDAAVKTAESNVTATAKNLTKSNNIRANGNSTEAARGSKAKTSNAAYKSFSAAKQSQDAARAVNNNLETIKVVTNAPEGLTTAVGAEKINEEID